jgi:peroxiredoxin
VGYNFGVGRQAPTFTLTAVDGNQISLTQYRGDWATVLVFLPTQTDGAEQALRQFSSSADTFWGLRAQVLVLCDADGDELRRVTDAVEVLAVPVLPDDGSVASRYGALGVSGESRPLTVIVDRAGKIVWEADGADAHKPAAVLAALRQVVR